ncbi:MAG: hypothetical protein KKA54_09995 [Proteobacteria bacterium]|nr:hypothetical protein [Pseudomonadota bacterium]MBU0966698.1 hypothetical protein [Pseudomonadota bacterium]
MNTQLTTASINSIGLIFDIVGAILVASEVVNQYKGKQYKENPTWRNLAEQSKSEEYVRHEKHNYHRMAWGLGFLIFGFLFQLLGQWWQPIIGGPAVSNFHQQIKALPTEKCTNSHNPPIVIHASQDNGNAYTKSATATEKNNNQNPPNENPIK